MRSQGAKIYSVFSDKKFESDWMARQLLDLVGMAPGPVSKDRGHTVFVEFEINNGTINPDLLKGMWFQIMIPQKPGGPLVTVKKLDLEIESKTEFAYRDVDVSETDVHGREWVANSRRLIAWTKMSDDPIVIDPRATVKVILHTRHIFTIPAKQILVAPEEMAVVIPLHDR